MSSRSVHLIISGRVQGVGYRAWTRANARRRGLAGWVRNRSDKTVEAVFTGPTPAVEDMISACHEGPLACRVREIFVNPYEETLTVTDFEMLDTVSV
jgi:acylphosphatase